MSILREALEAELGDALDCTRVWEAWSYRTMGPDDFVLVTERIDEMVDGIVLHLLTAPINVPREMSNEQSRAVAGLVAARRNFALALAELRIAEVQVERMAHD